MKVTTDELAFLLEQDPGQMQILFKITANFNIEQIYTGRGIIVKERTKDGYVIAFDESLKEEIEEELGWFKQEHFYAFYSPSFDVAEGHCLVRLSTGVIAKATHIFHGHAESISDEDLIFHQHPDIVALGPARHTESKS